MRKIVCSAAYICVFFCCSERKKISSTSYHLAWTEIRVNGLHCLGVFGVELPYQKKLWGVVSWMMAAGGACASDL